MKTNMQSTSLLAYAEVKKKLSPRHQEIVKIFRANTTMDLTNNEILREVRLTNPVREINSITPRVYELRGKGKDNPYRLHPYLIESRKRECDVTGEMAIAWQLNNK